MQPKKLHEKYKSTDKQKRQQQQCFNSPTNGQLKKAITKNSKRQKWGKS